MAASGAGAFAPVLAALSTMQSSAERSQKSQAHEYLETFQKSVSRTQIPSIRLNLIDIRIARSLVDDSFNSVLHRCHGRSKAIRCDDAERKSERFTAECPGGCLTSLTDYV